MWREPWNYREGFTIAILMMMLGFALELILGNGSLNMPPWPTNLVIVIILIAYLLYTSIFVKNHIVKFLSSITAAISATVIFVFIIILMGFIPQDETRLPAFLANLGFGNLKSSFPYMMSSVYLITVLGFTTIRRFKKLDIKNIAFFLNHAGLWIILVSASLGSGDFHRLKLQAEEGQTSMIAIDKNLNQYQLPFGIQLLDFKVTQYPPNLIMYSNKDNNAVYETKKGLEEVEEGKDYQYGEWNLKVEKYLPMAKMKGNIFFKDTTIGATYAAYITAINKEDTVRGWISPGNAFFRPIFLHLGEDYNITMTLPKPKAYESYVKILRMPEGEVENATISVNKPYKVKGYKIYQSGYNEEMGRWSYISSYDLVRDPWLPAVYIGFFMVLLGSLYLIWVGNKQN